MSNSKKDFERSGTTSALKRDLAMLSMSAIELIPASASSGHIHRSKRSKPMSNSSFDDLPEDVFAEILCRLACHKQLVRCNYVSKRWMSHVSFLIRDSNFMITRFMRLKRDSKTPIVRALMNSRGDEFRVAKVTTMKMKAKELITTVTMEVEELLTRMSSNAEDEALITTADFATIVTKTVEQSLGVICPKPLAPLFKSLMMSCNWKREPVVLATYNDLVLCRYGISIEKYDYYICNPYTTQFVALPQSPPSDEFERYAVFGFICDLDNSGSSRCTIVRIGQFEPSSEVKVEIFSSETGVYGDGRTIEFGERKPFVKCAGVSGGRLRFIGLDFNLYELLVWELEEEEDVRAHDRSGKLFLKCMRCNIRTRKWSKVPHGLYMFNRREDLFQLTVLPWWPTPERPIRNGLKPRKSPNPFRPSPPPPLASAQQPKVSPSLSVVEESRLRDPSMGYIQEARENHVKKKVEEALRSKMKQKAMKECKDYASKYAECSTGRTISVVWQCRQEAKELNNCLHQFTNDDILEQMKKDYMLQQEQKGSTRSLNPSSI
ncbi:hypothetical protein ACLB2K_054430 [Fragaria x ananassa]